MSKLSRHSTSLQNPHIWKSNIGMLGLHTKRRERDFTRHVFQNLLLLFERLKRSGISHYSILMLNSMHGYYLFLSLGFSWRISKMRLSRLIRVVWCRRWSSILCQLNADDGKTSPTLTRKLYRVVAERIGGPNSSSGVSVQQSMGLNPGRDTCVPKQDTQPSSLHTGVNGYLWGQRWFLWLISF